MGYLHIDNLYKNQTILLFKECYALEKIHGSSAHVTYQLDGQVTVFAGGESHSRFLALFDIEKLKQVFKDMGHPDKTITVYGEVYGGRCQGMSDTYGKDLKFVAFDVQIGDCWLSVPQAEEVCKNLGLEFASYAKVKTDLVDLDAQRDADSTQAIRNGVGEGKKREGVVLRPLVEMTLNNGSRVICKHKRDEFKETSTSRQVVDPEKMKVLEDATAVADEWVTLTRMQHVLDKLPGHCMEKMRDIISAMTEDVNREGKGEFIPSEAVNKAIGKRTATLYKDLQKAKLTEAATT